MKYCTVAKAVGWDRPICVEVNGSARCLRSAAFSINSGCRFLDITMCRRLRKRRVFYFVPSYLFSTRMLFVTCRYTRHVPVHKASYLFEKKRKKKKKRKESSRGADMSRSRKFLPKKRNGLRCTDACVHHHSPSTFYDWYPHISLIVVLACFVLSGIHF